MSKSFRVDFRDLISKVCRNGTLKATTIRDESFSNSQKRLERLNEFKLNSRRNSSLTISTKETQCIVSTNGNSNGNHTHNTALLRFENSNDIGDNC